ncbi:unnamed protein product [Ilex paraguariensis]|uniref:Uncharacterized protein n=1 Tax=Ilex paraguariensis TaxID=185542 RepID=A0ABC8QVV3_9AQUA
MKEREDVNNKVIENIEIDSGGEGRDDDLLIRDSDDDLVRNKAPHDKGLCSDQESSMKWENLSDNMEGIEGPLVDQEVANSIDFSPWQMPRSNQSISTF